MPTTNTSEAGLETLILESLTGEARALPMTDGIRETHSDYCIKHYVQGDPADYHRSYAVDLTKLTEFLRATQPAVIDALGLETDGPTRQKFLGRLQGEITKRGVIDVLRKGVKHGAVDLMLFYGTPTPGNVKAAERHRANIFSVTRQLRYSTNETRLALDLCLFINGLPIATFELKNNLTKQTVADAMQQYKNDRDPRELLFLFGRCIAHFALDDQEARFCTHRYTDFSPLSSA